MTEALRSDLIAALEYSRGWIEKSLDLHTCQHGGFFQGKATDCQNCANEEGCQWLAHNDQFIDLQFKSYDDLRKSLEYSASLIVSEMSRLRHEDDCECETCSWLHRTYKLLDME